MTQSMLKMPRGQDELAAIVSGIFTSIYPEHAPMWVAADNVVFHDLSVQKIKGREQLPDPPFSRENVNVGITTQKGIRGLAQARVGNERRIYLGTLENIWKWDGNTDYRLLGSGFNGQLNATTFAPATYWSLAPFGSFLLATNGVDAAQIWRNVGVALPLVSNFTTAEIFLVWGPYVIAYATDFTGEKGLQWSNADDPDDWVPTPTNDAGDFQIRELESEIRAAVPRGQEIIVYGASSSYIQRFVGFPNIFGVQPGASDFGASGKNAVIEVATQNGTRHFGMGRMGPWQSDGIRGDLLGTPAIQNLLNREVNWEQQSKIFAWHDREHKTVWWHVPGLPSLAPSFAIGFSYQYNSWTRRDADDLALAIPQSVFDYPISGDNAGGVFFESKGLNKNGQEITAFIQSKPLDMGSSDLYKYVDMLKLFLTNPRGNVTVKIGTSETPRGQIDFQDFGAPDDTQSVFPCLSGKYYHIRLEVSGLGGDFNWAGFEIFGAPDGGDEG